MLKKIKLNLILTWNQKLTPKKFHAEFLSVKKKFGWTLIAKLRRWDTRTLPWIFRLFWIVKKNPYLNQDTCQIFLLKKLPESKISNPKKTLWSSLSLKIQSNPLGFKDKAPYTEFLTGENVKMWLEYIKS